MRWKPVADKELHHYVAARCPAASPKWTCETLSRNPRRSNLVLCGFSPIQRRCRVPSLFSTYVSTHRRKLFSSPGSHCFVLWRWMIAADASTTAGNTTSPEVRRRHWASYHPVSLRTNFASLSVDSKSNFRSHAKVSRDLTTSFRTHQALRDGSLPSNFRANPKLSGSNMPEYFDSAMSLRDIAGMVMKRCETAMKYLDSRINSPRKI